MSWITKGAASAGGGSRSLSGIQAAPAFSTAKQLSPLVREFGGPLISLSSMLH